MRFAAMSIAGRWLLLVAFALALAGTSRADAQPATGPTIGSGQAEPITVVSSDGTPICPNFSFSQVPKSPNLFVSKLRQNKDGRLCAGEQTLALFQFDWRTHVMTLLHTLMSVPLEHGGYTIANAYDPYVAAFAGDVWVAFECVGPHIPGTSACIATLAPDYSRIDTSRLSNPIVGLDSNQKSPWWFSASTPKLLPFRGRLYLYWTAIQGEKAESHRWRSIETRGAELALDAAERGTLWVKGWSGKRLPSYTPGRNVAVMRPVAGDPYRDMSVDTEGLFVQDDAIIVLSSVGGSGPDGRQPCTKPLDRSPGCFSLFITRTTAPLERDSFSRQVATAPTLPSNPMEYPRIVTGPDGRTFLMATMHPVAVAPAPGYGPALPKGYLLMPMPLDSLRFAPAGN
jgi:hypothetical protein